MRNVIRKDKHVCFAAAACIVAFTVGLASPAGAQAVVRTVTPDSLTENAHVRAVVRSDSAKLEGFVRAVHQDTLLIASCKTCAGAAATPLVSLRALEVERRRAKNGARKVVVDMLNGLLYGSLLGAGVGAIAAYRETSKPDCRELCGLDWLLPLPWHRRGSLGCRDGRHHRGGAKRVVLAPRDNSCLAALTHRTVWAVSFEYCAT